MSDEKNTVFEDEFMEVQSDLISLVLEATKMIVDKIFAYCSIEKHSKMFNVFFEVGGEIKTLNLLGLDSAYAMQLLEIGTNDLDKIKEVCSRYNQPTPTEIKMYYDVKSGKYNAQYQYVEICSAKTKVSSGQVFMAWITEEKKKGTI